MRRATTVALATGLVMTVTGGASAVESDASGQQTQRLTGSSTTAAATVGDDQARKCIGKKKVRRARVFVTYKRLNRILGKKGTYWAGTYRVWDVCYSSYDLSAYVQKKKGKLRVYQIEAPPVGSAFRTDAGSVDDGTRGCISKRTVKRKLRPYMTFRKVKSVLGGAGTGTATTRAWNGCFGKLKVSLDRVKGKRRVDTVNVVSAA